MAGKRTKRSTSAVEKSNKKTKIDTKDSTKKKATPIADDEQIAALQQKLPLPMPKDFFDVWHWCLGKSPRSPSDALTASLGVRLSGPYDILSGKVENDARSQQLHGRYYYDPPEFTTVIESTAPDDGFHIGYYRDTPNSLPCLVASNDINKGYGFDIVGDNLFAALLQLLGDGKSKSQADEKTHEQLEVDLISMAGQRNLDIVKEPPSVKLRKKSVVTNTFHGLGIVVSLDENEVGYRPLSKSDTQLKKMLQRIIDCKSDEERRIQFEQLREILTLIQFANDECDYGMGYELGIDLFLVGCDLFHKSCDRLLSLAYDLLEMTEFGDILQAHLNERQRPSITCYL